MFKRRVLAATLSSAALALLATPAFAAEESRPSEPVKPTGPDRIFQSSEVASTGSVTIGGKAVTYQAIAGTLVVHGPGWDDVAWREQAAAPSPDKDKEGVPPETSMFFPESIPFSRPIRSRLLAETVVLLAESTITPFSP